MFIYMELIDRIPLADEWPEMDTEERYHVCSQLTLRDLRNLQQDPADPFIGL